MPDTLNLLEGEQVFDQSTALDYLMPLLFYYQDPAQLPPLAFIHGSSMPGHQRHLLVHDSDMTPRLQEFHRSEINLQVHHKEESNDYLLRVVVLNREGDGKPVEFGAIGIRLDPFTPWQRRDIRAGTIPLGSLLAREKFAHSSHPRAFFKITADALMAQKLACAPETVLYGRCNELRDEHGMVFADIVEILPPE